jgi:hypothetical protein
MSIFSRNDDDELLDDFDGNMFARNSSYEERKSKLERAREIHSGLVMGTFERDEEVWDFVKKLDE